MLAAVAVSQLEDRSVAEASESGHGRPVSAKLVGVGRGGDHEPGPSGTLITGPEPADRYWVQGLSPESFDYLAEEHGSATASTVRWSPAERTTSLAVRRGSDHRLIGANAGGDPADVVDLAFDLGHLPAGARFVPIDPSSASSASFEHGEEVVDDLTEGSALVQVTLRDGRAAAAVRVPGAAAGLSGLLRDLRMPGEDTYVGEIGPGQFVTIVGDSQLDQALVVDGRASVPSLMADRGTVSAAVDAAVRGR